MVLSRLRTPADPALDFDAIRTELGVPGPFPVSVEVAARTAAEQAPPTLVDATAIELVTIDPPGSRDLDQAVAIEALVGGGWRVHYAIADVASWVSAGGPIDLEARTRTQTFYLPDGRTPLHPPALSEAAASLLPDGPRPAALWTIDVTPDGEIGTVDVRRASVRSRARLDYATVQADLDQGTAHASIAAFGELGRALLADARRRNAIELGLPEQVVVPGRDGHWAVQLRADLPIEGWNAQVSLLTGRAAAALMLGAGIGILRTLPTPDHESFPRLQRSAHSLGIHWPSGAHPGAVLAGLDPSVPRHAAFADLAAELLRGAGYTAFDGPPPADPGHAGIGGPYAHVTAPLRRLVDRFGTEVCLAVAAGTDVPTWVRDALPTLPELMAAGDSLAHKVDRAVIDATEAFVLADRVGEVFAAAVIETGKAYGTVVVDDPAVRGRCDTPHLPLGGTIQVRCTVADVATRTVRFERVA